MSPPTRMEDQHLIYETGNTRLVVLLALRSPTRHAIPDDHFFRQRRSCPAAQTITPYPPQNLPSREPLSSRMHGIVGIAIVRDTDPGVKIDAQVLG